MEGRSPPTLLLFGNLEKPIFLQNEDLNMKLTTKLTVLAWFAAHY